uniref:Uncharacterized protein n=1 Tax=Plectus sambesii TaxID=2011161 RepID=A0A914W788_9BILA
MRIGRINPAQSSECLYLATLIIEVIVGQPSHKSSFQCGPFIIENREIGCVSVAAFEHKVLPEQTLKPEAKSLGSPFRTLILVVALPFNATITQSECFFD